MSEQENNQFNQSEEVTRAETETTVIASETEEASSEAASKKSNVKLYVAAIVAVVVIILGALYLMEKEGRSSTNIFAGLLAKQEANAVVATVNGEEIVNSQLNTSIQQFSQAATAQGVDISSPDVQREIRSQALEVLVNTELLKQAAEEQGVAVTDEEVTERLNTITNDIGGEEVLAERMEVLGINPDQLQSDIKDEITIQKLLNIIFVDAGVSVSEEEISEVYDNAQGAGAELPALEEVRVQVEAQLKASKEQAAIDDYLSTLKAEAEIEIVEG